MTGNLKNVINLPEDRSMCPVKGLGEYMYEKMVEFSHLIAQINSENGEQETFAELLSRCIRVAQSLKIKGVTSNDIISICCFNNMEYVVVFIASLFVGAKVSTLDPAAPLMNSIHNLKLIKPKIIFCDETGSGLMRKALSESGIRSDIVTFYGNDEHSFSQYLVVRGTENNFKVNNSVKLFDTAVICYSSGTSGLAKAVEMTHFGLYFASMSFYRHLDGVKTIMCCTVPYWISNVGFLVLSTLKGFTRVICKSYDSVKHIIYKIMQDYKVNYTILTQAMINDLIQNPSYHQYDTSHLIKAVFGGTKIGVQQILQLQNIFPHTTLYNGYGMTELCGIVFDAIQMSKTELETVKHCYVGVPLPGMQYKVVDAETEINLGPNQRGELRLKYKSVMNGYYGQPEATGDAFDSDGFYKTGDIAYYDENHKFYIVDRMKEIFKYKAWHISPAIIEDVLLMHPDIKSVAVIGIPHKLDNEHPLAVVVLQENAQVTEIEIIQYVSERLPDWYHLRGGVRIMDQLPTTNTGKTRRNFIREMILKENGILD